MADSSKPYTPPYLFVEIVWDDAASNSETWVTTDAIAGPEQVITRGWLVKETDKYVAIAGSVANEAIENETVGNTMTIPLGMIVSRRELKLATARPRKRKVKADA
ncbi:MAG: hypothetical protein ACXWNL_16170 [Vulcanimicrobiaceae bacterium]